MSVRPLINIIVTSDYWKKNRDLYKESLIEDILVQTLNAVDLPENLKTHQTEISINMSDDEAVRLLNKEYRGKDKPTNVLSFGMYEADMPVFDGETIMLGDIILSFETIYKEAEEQQKDFDAHLLHMIAHGALHLLGYDHEDECEAEKMETLEVKILSHLGIENPYKNTNCMAD